MSTSEKFPKVYLLLVNWNGWADTIECLDSVFANHYPNFQVVVLDNASQNDSLEHIKQWASDSKAIPVVEYGRELAERGGDAKQEAHAIESLPDDMSHPLILVQTGDNLGFAGGNNVGLRYLLAKGDAKYAWLLNNDTVIDPQALAEMVTVAESDPQIGIVGSKLLFYHRPNIVQVLGGTNEVTWKNTGEWIHGFEEDRPDFATGFEIHGYVCGASLLIKKGVIEDIGLLDENYFMWVEEVDWCVRASRNGYKMFYCGTSIVWHKEGASSGKSLIKSFLGRSSERVNYHRFMITGYYGARNRTYLVKKFFRRELPKFIMVLLLENVRKIVGILLYDDFKWRRIKLLFRGAVDGLSCRMGRMRN